jgi:outer membrane protein assembly factor BamB
LADLALSASGLIIVPVSDGTLRAFLPTGEWKWSVTLGGGVSAPAIAADGTIYVTTANKLFAVNPDGSIAWSLPGAFASSTPSVGKDGKVYVGVDGTSLLAVSPAGVQVFKATPVGAAAQSRHIPQPAIGAGTTAYFVAGGNVYAVGP